MRRTSAGDASAKGGEYDQECGRECWTSSQNHKANDVEERWCTDLGEEEEEEARLLGRCEAKREEWSKHWQCNEEIQTMQNKPWRNEELKGM